VKILVLSDLHVDAWADEPLDPESHFENRRIEEGADVIVLAGDIHEGVKAPIWAGETFPDKPIVMVAGNHEFYNGQWHASLKELREKSQQLGIHFLEDDAVEIGGVRFLGCTLWTDFMLYGEDAASKSATQASFLMSDYHLIGFDQQPGAQKRRLYQAPDELRPIDSIERHLASVAWLERQLAEGDPARTVVVTHHAPSAKSIPPEFANDVLSPAYASSLERLMGRSAVWIHGHVHDSYDYRVEGTRVVCNPRGYPDRDMEPLNPLFDLSLMVEV